jgi:hypothetical protein
MRRQPLCKTNFTINYSEEFSYTNVECNVYLLRDLSSCVANTQHRWADDLAQLIGDTYKKRKQLIDDRVNGYSFLETEVFL